MEVQQLGTPRPRLARIRAGSPLREEIVRRAIELFNRNGAASVSGNVIAADLGISSGNLHYHFRTRADLDRAVYTVMEDELRHALRVTEERASVPHLVARQIEVQRTLWTHRYFFAGLDVMMRKDPATLARFVELQAWAVERIEALLRHYMAAGVVRLIDLPDSPPLIAQNIWMLWASWVRWEVMTQPDDVATADGETVVQRLVDRHFSLLAVLMPPALASEVSRRIASTRVG